MIINMSIVEKEGVAFTAKEFSIASLNTKLQELLVLWRKDPTQEDVWKEINFILNVGHATRAKIVLTAPARLLSERNILVHDDLISVGENGIGADISSLDEAQLELTLPPMPIKTSLQSGLRFMVDPELQAITLGVKSKKAIATIPAVDVLSLNLVEVSL